ncbi:MAG TPA: V-type ATP synthase subunit D [Candidatus Paceibacterota bacterium]|nr:V-type ATP synthase subunit D [Verrucomicrobiota bacterium]HRY46440.1 V-type ATP synthase subunit D [Candidatus Paceibacterota bacterium]HSA02018.1 V-type ATP synthase subunit D [Candidatus Paceibacterota bacterium]
MAKLNIPPTKSTLLQLKRQLAFAEEGYDLLDQKRQILVFELLNHLDRAQKTERRLEEVLRRAHAALREALLDIGSEALDRAALGVRMDHQATISPQSLMGLRLPHVQSRIETAGVRFGFSGTSANTDLAMQRFVEALPLAAELAELENAVIRLARELRKTQRRCNALSKILIPAHQETIIYIAGSLEERERESFTILKRIRERYGTAGRHPQADSS